MIRYGSGVLPDGSDASPIRSPIVNYSYARMRPILDRLARTGEADPFHAFRMRYANPLNGGWVTPTMGAHLALLPKGFAGKPYRATDATVFACKEGRGTTVVDGKELKWTPNDVFVIPAWKHYSHHADEDAVLFGISDRPAQEVLGLWREDRAGASGRGVR